MLALILPLLTSQTGFEPISTRMSGVYVVARVHTSDGKDHPFLIDSGANVSFVLKTALAEKDQKRDSTEVRLDIGAKQIFGKAHLLDASEMPATAGKLPIEGILGLNILRQIQLDIDYETCQVKARYGAALSWAGADYTAHLLSKDSNNLYTVPVKIGEKNARVSVDTGATAFLLYKKKVDLSGYSKLAATRMRTFKGMVEMDRYLIDSVELGDHKMPWAVVNSYDWNDPDDGTIGTSMMGGNRVVLDFPGSCIYVGKSDPIGQAASRILGMPVQVEGEGLRFRNQVPDFFKPYATFPILSLRRTKSTDLVAALKKSTPEARETLVKTFKAMREPGLVTTQRNGKPELLPLQVED